MQQIHPGAERGGDARPRPVGRARAGFLAVCWVAGAACTTSPATPAEPEAEALALMAEDRRYTVVPEALFERLGWSLPDGGGAVKRVADAAPGGAFDPAELAELDPTQLGYRARWHVVRYSLYGFDWDIAGLLLTPVRPAAGLPTVAFLNGGAGNWYQFFVDPLNGPAVGQYLAQRVPVFLMTIPGNYKSGGWEESDEDPIPAYVLDREIGADEARIRHAVYTFRVVSEGVRRLIEEATEGPVLIVGHSTGGEVQFLLKDSGLRPRLRDLSLGWGTGAPALITRQLHEDRGTLQGRIDSYSRRPPEWLGRRTAISANYIGPLNPVPGESVAEVAQRWFELESRRSPRFKQLLQDAEHQGTTEVLARLEPDLRDAVRGGPPGLDLEEVRADLFSTMRVPLSGYRKMIWTVGRLDRSHWDADDPETSREVLLADEFRRHNPGVPIRVVLFDVPMTHHGHMERPRQLAGGLLAAVRWLEE